METPNFIRACTSDLACLRSSPLQYIQETKANADLTPFSLLA